ncbi:MAG: SPOR domain-containing protein, partial [Treponema sp.]|nr:SPOR domain-containing protein [Treponema sp.]
EPAVSIAVPGGEEPAVGGEYAIDTEQPADGTEKLAAGAESARTGEGFSVPVISRPEKGKYYLQLGAYTRAELVEAALSHIEGYYPLAVQTGGTFEEPVYRILLGPVNLGEGGALLQRFKRGGYRDAFLKQDN